jgi:thiol-disulfide isomerase/thioredoxin
MSNNIVRVLNEKDLTEILNNNLQRIVLVMYSSKTCGPCQSIKPTFIKLARTNTDTYFVYVDLSDFDDQSKKFVHNIKGVPKFSYYYNNHELLNFTGANEELMVNNLHELKHKIKERIAQLQMEERQNSEAFQQKITMLKRLYMLHDAGIKLSKMYDMDSDYAEMCTEYNYHMSKLQQEPQVQQPVQQPVQPQVQQPVQPVQVPEQPVQVPEQQPVPVQVPEPQVPVQPVQMQAPEQQVQVPVQEPQVMQNGNMHINKIEELQKLKQLWQYQNAQNVNQLQQLKKLKELKEQNERRMRLN